MVDLILPDQDCDDPGFGRINTRVPKVAMLRLRLACQKQSRIEVNRVTQGRIITDLIMGRYPEGLPPHPNESAHANLQQATKKLPRLARKESTAA